MRLHLVWVLVFAAFVSSQKPPGKAVTQSVSMVEIEACRIELTPVGNIPRWGGQAAVYDLKTDDAGTVRSLTRRVIPDREHLPPLVRLDQFESCVRRWRFGDGATYEVAVIGGTVAEGSWTIDVRRGDRQLRLRIPR